MKNSVQTQNQRITHEVKDGQITHQEARQLRANDRGVRAQERSMAKQDGSHLTKVDDRALNQELNKNSKAIGR